MKYQKSSAIQQASGQCGLSQKHDSKDSNDTNRITKKAPDLTTGILTGSTRSQLDYTSSPV